MAVTQLIDVSLKADLDPATGLVKATQLPPTTTQQQLGSYLESGGNVAYLSTAYNFRVSPASYVIQGDRYRSILTDVSLGAADATFNRFDCIIVDTSGAVSVVAGTPASNPATPDIDPATQLVLSTILITANSTTPSITTESIYAENTEWTSSVNGASMNAASASSPFAGTKCILANGASSGHYVRLTRATAMSVASQKQLIFMIKSGGAFPSQKTIRITFYLSGAKIGTALSLSNGRYGFIHSNTTTYQQIVIPMTEFGIPASSTVDRIEFYVNGSGNTITFRLDNIYLEPTSTAVEPTVLTIEGSQITGPYTTCGMTMSQYKILGRFSANQGPAEELDLIDVLTQQSELLTDISDFAPAATSASLTYSSDGDANGVFSQIRTELPGGSANPNGATNGVALLSDTSPTSSIGEITNRTTVDTNFYFPPTANWVVVDLGVGRTLQVNRYSIRNRAGFGNFACLRTWKIQGSNNVATNDASGVNAATWTTIKTHSNDTTINTSAQWYSPTVTPNGTGYRWLRLLRDGLDSDGSAYIIFDEWEFYGSYQLSFTAATAGPMEFSGTTLGVVRTAGATVVTTTGNIDNLATTNASVLVMNNASASVLRGILASDAYNGKTLVVISIGAGSVTINHQDTNSTAANRIITSTGAPVYLPAGLGRAELVYDTTNSRWRCHFVPYDVAPVAISALDIDWTQSNTFTKTLSTNSTFTFSNTISGRTIIVAVTNTASNYTVTWPTISWSGGGAPTQTVGAKTDVYTFIKIGSTIYGSVLQNF